MAGLSFLVLPPSIPPCEQEHFYLISVKSSNRVAYNWRGAGRGVRDGGKEGREGEKGREGGRDGRKEGRNLLVFSVCASPEILLPPYKKKGNISIFINGMNSFGPGFFHLTLCLWDLFLIWPVFVAHSFLGTV